jgi:hypothetical protein
MKDYWITAILILMILISGCIQEQSNQAERINIDNINKISISKSEKGMKLSEYRYYLEIINQKNNWNGNIEICNITDLEESCNTSEIIIESNDINTFLNKLSTNVFTTKPSKQVICWTDYWITYKIEISDPNKIYTFTSFSRCDEPWEVKVDNRTMWAPYSIINDVKNLEKYFKIGTILNTSIRHPTASADVDSLTCNSTRNIIFTIRNTGNYGNIGPGEIEAILDEKTLTTYPPLSTIQLIPWEVSSNIVTDVQDVGKHSMTIISPLISVTTYVTC